MYDKGRYIAEVTNQELSETKGSGAKGPQPQFVLTFRPLGMRDLHNPGGELIACDEYERSIFRVINDKTIEYVLEDLEALGFEGTSFDQLSQSHPNCYSFVGKEIEVSCQHEEYQGKTVERWSLAKNGGGFIPKKLDSQSAKKLDAMFGQKLKGKFGKTAATARKPHAGSMPKEEIAAAQASNDSPF